MDVTLSVNVFTEFGLIPPFSSEWESEEGTPNNFVLNDIPPQTTITILAWMQLPRNQYMNGTAEMIVEMRSTLDPDIVFTNRTEYEFLGENWRPENVDSVSAWDEFVLDVQSFWNAWGQFLISLVVIMIGAVALHRAVVYRQRRDAEWDAMIAARNVEPEKVEDWMDKFSEKGSTEPVVPSSPAMDAGAFKTAFGMRSKTKPGRDAPSEKIMQAANTVFEHHDEKADYAAIDSLSEDLLDDSGPHEANQVLPATEEVKSRTVRHERKEPANEKKTDDYDIDLDL